MRRSIVLLLALTVGLALGAFPVMADTPTAVSGTWDYELTAPPEIKVVGPDVFIYGQDRGEWAGSFEGYTEETFVVLCRASEGFSFYRGEMTFYGTVYDDEGIAHQGTMALEADGKQFSDTCDPSPAEWVGEWVIVGGTEGLANLRGRGTFTGPSFHLRYEGQILFE